MGKTHTINLQDLISWDNEQTFASATYERKRLTMIAQKYRVYVGSEIVLETNSPSDAVEKYNSISSKYINPFKNFTI